MKNPVETLLREKGYVVLDGALATELERRGHDLDDPLWSAKILLEDPDAIAAVSRDYLASGADVAISASYQASFEGFAARGLSEQETVEVLRRSVAIVKQACRSHGSGLAAASVGCYGAYLHDGSEYSGDYSLSRRELEDFHRRRLEALASAEPDLIAFETIPSLLEAEVVTQLASELDLWCWLSFSCRDGAHVSHGEAFGSCVERIGQVPSVAGVGVNCTPPQYISELLEHGRNATDIPLVVYPNSGEIWDGQRHQWQEAEEDFSIVEHVAAWHRQGAALLGGCCRTTPETIKGIRDALAQPKTL